MARKKKAAPVEPVVEQGPVAVGVEFRPAPLTGKALIAAINETRQARDAALKAARDAYHRIGLALNEDANPDPADIKALAALKD